MSPWLNEPALEVKRHVLYGVPTSGQLEQGALIMKADKRQELFASRKHTDTPQSTVAASAGLDLCDCWHSCDCRVEG